jgi:hypothetical protein
MMNTLYWDHFVKNQKYKSGGRLEIKINILYYEETHELLHLDKWNLVKKNIAGIHTRFI